MKKEVVYSTISTVIVKFPVNIIFELDFVSTYLTPIASLETGSSQSFGIALFQFCEGVLFFKYCLS